MRLEPHTRIGLPDREAIARTFDRLGVAAIDLNPRVYGSLALASGAGVGLAARWCGSLPGAPEPFADAPPGVSYRREEGDLAHALWALRHGQVRAALAALAPQPRVTHALLAPGDPGPLFARAVNLVASRTRRLVTLRRSS